jgi:hypothetical protein
LAVDVEGERARSGVADAGEAEREAVVGASRGAPASTVDVESLNRGPGSGCPDPQLVPPSRVAVCEPAASAMVVPVPQPSAPAMIDSFGASFRY